MCSSQWLSRALLAATVWVCVIGGLGSRFTYSQAKDESPGSIRKTRRTLPLTKFYDTPNLAPGKPGDLIRSDPFDGYDLPFDVVAVRILYHSRSTQGQDVPVSGVVLYPDAKPPAGGWPVIAWAHDRNGVARPCAPSLARNVLHGPFLAMYVKLGYAVVATDYAGLGAAGRNAGFDNKSNASDVIYSVPAARSAVPKLNSRWVAIGIGEGGPAVVAIAELEHDLGDSNYLGSIAISTLDDPEVRYHDEPLLLAYGIQSVYPGFHVESTIEPKALPLYAQLEQSCSESRAVSGQQPSEILSPDWAANKVVKEYLNRNILGQSPAQAPLLVITSGSDLSTSMKATAKMIDRLCERGDRVRFNSYPQSDAGTVFGDSVREQISWVQARFEGAPEKGNCSQQH